MNWLTATPTKTHEHTGYWTVHSPFLPFQFSSVVSVQWQAFKWQWWCTDRRMIRVCQFMYVWSCFSSGSDDQLKGNYTHTLCDRVWAQQKFRQQTIMCSCCVCAVCFYVCASSSFSLTSWYVHITALLWSIYFHVCSYGYCVFFKHSFLSVCVFFRWRVCVHVCEVVDIRCRWFPVASLWQAASACLFGCTSLPLSVTHCWCDSGDTLTCHAISNRKSTRRNLCLNQIYKIVKIAYEDQLPNCSVS